MRNEPAGHQLATPISRRGLLRSTRGGAVGAAVAGAHVEGAVAEPPLPGLGGHRARPPRVSGVDELASFAIGPLVLDPSSDAWWEEAAWPPAVWLPGTER